MKYYDIARELFTAPVFPGNPEPEHIWLKRIQDGLPSNLTYLKMCAHNGTHMDAPLHFVDGGRTIEQIPLEQVMGPCSVIEAEGIPDGAAIAAMIAGRRERILWKGDVVFLEDGAQAMVDAGVRLVGVEARTVGPMDDTSGNHRVGVHRILLGADLTILEGLNLSEVPAGDYFLCAQPLKLGECEGSPCRPVLIEGIL